MKDTLPSFESARLAALALLAALPLSLSGCVMFQEPVESPAPAPARQQPQRTPVPRAGGAYPAAPGAPVTTAPFPPPPAAAPAPAPAPAPATRQFHLGAAATALVAEAHRQAGSGDPMLAITTIERALRIEPDNPLLWIELGEAHQAAGQFEQAGGLGRKALQLATGDPQAQAASWRLIAESLKSRGRNQEALEAQQHAEALSAR